MWMAKAKCKDMSKDMPQYEFNDIGDGEMVEDILTEVPEGSKTPQFGTEPQEKLAGARDCGAGIS